MDPLGHVERYAYDGMDRVTETTRRDGGVEKVGYDRAGRVVQETDALGNATKYEYDALGQVLRVQDALGQETLFGYDALGNLVEQTGPDGGVTAYTYDEAGRITASTDALGLETTYTYNALSQIESIRTGRTSILFRYDRMGNITEMVDEASGVGVTYLYDVAGDRVRTLNPDLTADIVRDDELGPVTAHGVDAGTPPLRG